MHDLLYIGYIQPQPRRDLVHRITGSGQGTERDCSEMLKTGLSKVVEAIRAIRGVPDPPRQALESRHAVPRFCFPDFHRCTQVDLSLSLVFLLLGFSLHVRFLFHLVLVAFSSVHSLSRVRLFVTSWTTVHQASLSITNSGSSPRLMFIESVMPSNNLILCHPLLFLPSIFPSIRVFSNESALPIRWPKHWSFSFSISPSNEYAGLISFRMDWFDLLAIQGTLKSLLQHHRYNLLYIK